MNKTISAAAFAGLLIMTTPYPGASASPLGVTRSAVQAPDNLIEQVRGGGRGGGGGGHRAAGGGGHRAAAGGAHRGGSVAHRGGANVHHANRNANVNRNVNRNTNVNRNVNRNVTRTGNWSRPGNYWWRPGGAVAAGAAIGFVTAASAAAWAGPAPGPNMCWYYTDASQHEGFWDACP